MQIKRRVSIAHPSGLDAPEKINGNAPQSCLCSPGKLHSPNKDPDSHFKRLFTRPVDFRELAHLDPDFASVVRDRDLDFQDPKSVKQLTRTLLRLKFGIEIDLPDDRLCPPVPNRHNYILWLKDLLDTSSYDKPGQTLTGLDIGTGASCIYPLLGCVQRPWSFIATDIDPKNVEYASSNVKRNELSSRIQVVQRSVDSPLIPLNERGIPSINFTMTNPPFYGSEEAMLLSAKQKKRPPYTSCTGSKVEMVTIGGELAFVRRIFNESLHLKDQVRWYTAMFGFLSSLTEFIAVLREANISNYAVTELLQGSKTRRWAIAWSFRSMRPAQFVARGTKSAASKNILPPVSEAEVLDVDFAESIGKFASSISAAVGTLDVMSWEWDKETYEGIGRVRDKVWARAWRRRKKREKETGQVDESQTLLTPEGGKVFGFKVWIRVKMKHVSVGCRWLEGFDAATFESFQGFLRATAKSAAGI